jgi:hypothetical protein
LYARIRPAALEDLLGVLHRREDPHRFVGGRAVRPEVRRRSVLEVRHVKGRGAVESVERHVERMPRAGQLQSGDPRRVDVFGDGRVVVEPPAPLRVSSEEIVDESLHDLVIRPEPPAYGILERVVPLRPGILLADRGRGLEQRPARAQGRGDLGVQLPG